MASLYSWVRLVDLVVALWLEAEVPGLIADHGHEPADERGNHRVLEHHYIGDQKADRAQKVQRLG